MRARLLSIAMLVASCGGPATAPPLFVSARPKPPPPPITRVLAPLSEATTAPWREVETKARRIADIRESEELPTVIGVRTAVFWPSGTIVHVDLGVVTGIPWPTDTLEVAIDGEDHLFARTRDVLYRANDALAASEGHFDKLLTLPNMRALAATKGLVAVADASSLRVSINAGKTFVQKALPKNTKPEHVFARPDGVIALVAFKGLDDVAGVYLSQAGGPFVESAMDNRLAQAGGVIRAHGCPNAILSSDGKTWVRETDTSELEVNWGEALQRVAYSYEIPRALRTMYEPKPPPPTPADVTTEAPWPCGVNPRIHLTSILKRRCTGASCIRATAGTLPLATPTDVALYGDGSCAQITDGVCTTWKRTPHAWLSTSKTPLRLPDGCAPRALFAAGGIGVVFCERDPESSDIYTVDRSGIFRSEGSVKSVELEEMTIASDGTLVVHPYCRSSKLGLKDPCKPAIVRSPLALGAKDAWRITRVESPYTFRVLPNGNALVVAAVNSMFPASGDPQKFALYVDRRDGPQVLHAGVSFREDLIDLEVRPAGIVITTGSLTEKDKSTQWWIEPNGLAKVTP